MVWPSYLQCQGTAVLLTVKVQPRASRNEIQGTVGAALKIRITAPPVDSAANEALVRFLAEQLDCPRRQVQLARGHASRHKVIRIEGLAPEQVVARLEPPDR